MSKSFFKSKTVWFGILQIILGVYGFVTGMMEPQAASTLIITGITSISLRLSTTTPIQGF